MIKQLYTYLFCALCFVFLTSNKVQACTGRDVIFTNITITSIASGDYQYSYQIKNIGTTDIAFKQLVIQNYVSTDDVVGSDAAAGGSFINNTSTDVLAAGATYEGTMGAYPFAANPQSTYPYLIAKVYISTDPECDVTNDNFVAKIEIASAITPSLVHANATVNWMADSKSFNVSEWSGNTSDLQYSVYTSSGVLMISGSTKKNETTPLNGLQNGYYILYLTDGEKVYSKKFVY